VTGDIGEWQPNGAMKIIDRKKNIFKLSQGEYVAVENLENIFLQCPAIDAVCSCCPVETSLILKIVQLAPVFSILLIIPTSERNLYRY
jgi:long-subunit acyl-CoA synthetase (AMP-forming)